MVWEAELDLAFRLAPRINAAGRLYRADAGVELMLTLDPVRAEEIALELERANRDRQGTEAECLVGARAALAALPAGMREAPILVLTEFPRGSEKEALAAGLTPTLYTDEGLASLGEAAGTVGRLTAGHVKLDTGMHRVGCAPDDALRSALTGALTASDQEIREVNTPAEAVAALGEGNIDLVIAEGLTASGAIGSLRAARADDHALSVCVKQPAFDLGSRKHRARGGHIEIQLRPVPGPWLASLEFQHQNTSAWLSNHAIHDAADHPLRVQP